MDKIIPVLLGRQLRSHSANSRIEKLSAYLKIRDFIVENKHKIELMQFYKEAAYWMQGISPKTVQDNLGIIREYPDAQLSYWMKNGISFNHIAEANRLQNMAGAKYNEAAPILGDAITLGNGEGNTMTVDEMITYVLGEKSPVYKSYNIIKILNGWISELPTRFSWSSEKTKMFEARIQDLKNDFFNE